MKIKTTTRGGALISTALCAVSTLVSASLYMSGNLTNAAELKSKSAALKQVVDEYKGDRCWFQPGDQPFKIGDLVKLEGTNYGTSPTSCVANFKQGVPSKYKQFAEIKYKDGELVVTNVFSNKDVQGQIQGK